MSELKFKLNHKNAWNCTFLIRKRNLLIIIQFDLSCLKWQFRGEFTLWHDTVTKYYITDFDLSCLALSCLGLNLIWLSFATKNSIFKRIDRVFIKKWQKHRIAKVILFYSFTKSHRFYSFVLLFCWSINQESQLKAETLQCFGNATTTIHNNCHSILFEKKPHKHLQSFAHSNILIMIRNTRTQSERREIQFNFFSSFSSFRKHLLIIFPPQRLSLTFCCCFCCCCVFLFYFFFVSI